MVIGYIVYVAYKILFYALLPINNSVSKIGIGYIVNVHTKFHFMHCCSLKIQYQKWQKDAL